MNGIYLYFVNKTFLVGPYWDFKRAFGELNNNFQDEFNKIVSQQ